MSTDDDADQLRRAKAGDTQALGRLIERFRPHLVTLAHKQRDHRLQSRLGTSDLVADVVTQVIRSISRFPGEQIEDFVNWLTAPAKRTMIKTKAVHFTKKRNPARERPVKDINQLPQAAVSPTPSEIAMQREDGMHLHDALAKLPDEMRSVVLARHKKGYSFSEIAGELGLSVENARVLVERGQEVSHFRGEN